MTIGSKDVIFLLGAGASAEAGIPTSATMIERIEDRLIQNNAWKPYLDLYNHLKSAIYHAAGLRGKFGGEVAYNIETLVNTLNELERNEDHPLFPFIATWNQRFVGLAKPDFSRVKEFRLLILDELKKWMCPDDTSRSDYYRGLTSLQQELNFPLPIFSLNYDLCVERLSNSDFRVETGFGGFGQQHFWDWERFEETDSNPSAEIILYKLHGSINWKRHESTKQVYSIEQVQGIDSERMELIFGRDFKLEAGDPYLFYAYAFRQYTLRASLIVSVGYGFGDMHINKMLTQGLRTGNHCRLLAICKCEEAEKCQRRKEISQALELENDEESQAVVHRSTTKEFLEMDTLADFLKDKMPKSDDDPF